MARNNLAVFRSKIAAGKTCFGINLSLADAAISELICDAGYDFTWLDAEHGPLTIKSLEAHIARTRGSETAPFVRVPWNDPVLIKPVLELEPAGIIIPMVSSPTEAQQAASACKYPPLGIRGYGPRRGIRYGADDFGDYLNVH